MSEKRIYLDHAATTRILPEIISEIAEYIKSEACNPSSKHTEGRLAYQALETARKRIADLFNCRTDRVTFTSGGTEADNLGLIGTALALPADRHRILVSAIEHDAVLNAAHYLETQGFEVEYLMPDKDGIITLAELEKHLDSHVGLVCVMYVNHETGMIQPVRELARLTHSAGALYMTDAVQAAPYQSLDTKELGCDLMTISGHKIGGPEGTGALFVKDGVKVVPLAFGGHQESGLRPGTENVMSLVGFGKACELLQKERIVRSKNAARVKESLIAGITTINGIHFHGDPQNQSVGHINVSFDGVEGEVMVAMLDRRGVAASTGAACRESEGTGSPILRAMKVPENEIRTAIRLTPGYEQSQDDMKLAAEAIREVSEKYRNCKI